MWTCYVRIQIAITESDGFVCKHLDKQISQLFFSLNGDSLHAAGDLFFHTVTKQLNAIQEKLVICSSAKTLRQGSSVITVTGKKIPRRKAKLCKSQGFLSGWVLGGFYVILGACHICGTEQNTLSIIF